MQRSNLRELNRRIGGKQVVKIEPSKWSGRVRSLMNNDHFLSIRLEDGTVLEAGSLFIRESEKAFMRQREHV